MPCATPAATTVPAVRAAKIFVPSAPLCFRACFHVHFAENLGKELHPVIIIHSKELVVVPLGYLMADSLTVDNGGHPVFPSVCAG